MPEKPSRIYAKSIFSGILISIASFANMSTEGRTAGAFIFSVALISIFAAGAYLYTGAVGNTAAVHRAGWIPFLAVVLAGNLTGTLVCGLVFPFMDAAAPVREAAVAAWETKTSQGPLSAFISSSLCGFLMYCAWRAHSNQQKNPVLAVLAIVLCVMTFVLARFDHSIANAFQLAFAGSWDPRSIMWQIIMIAGNSVGAVIPGYIFREPVAD